MKPGTLIASLAVLLILAGCATTQVGSTRACNDQVCHVTISVGPGCDIKADPETLEVKVKNTGVELHWDIDTSGWAFNGTGIVVQRDDRQEFSGGHVAEQGRKYILHDKNSFTKQYKYEVHVKSGDQVCSLDPWVFNN
ncbi:MAG TPA: hypothetical protein VF925_02650 [Casimicrobiaceae bacterium]|jgi:hypothetical protein